MLVSAVTCCMYVFFDTLHAHFDVKLGTLQSIQFKMKLEWLHKSCITCVYSLFSSWIMKNEIGDMLYISKQSSIRVMFSVDIVEYGDVRLGYISMELKDWCCFY